MKKTDMDKSTRPPWLSILGMGAINACVLSTVVGFFLIAGLLGNRYADSPVWSTLPLAAFVASIMLFVIPASWLMARHGRRAGFAFGSIAGMLGGLLIIVSVHYQSFFAIVGAGLMIGLMGASATYLRFAALEVTEKEMHGRAASVVLGGGIIAAVVGPHLGTVVHQLTGIETYRAFGQAVIAINAVALLLVVATRFGTPPAPPALFAAPRRLLRSVKSLLRSPLFLRAAIASVSGYAIMSLVMNATPLTLTDLRGHSLVTTAFVMQNHLLGMFVPFVFSGYLLDRIGAARIVYAGFVVYAVCFATLLLSSTVFAFHIGLTLLGVGWNFTFLGGTTLLFAAALAKRGAIAQPLNEFCTNLGNFLAASFAGAMLYTTGWASILALGALAVALMVAVFGWNNRRSLSATQRLAESTAAGVVPENETPGERAVVPRA